MAGSADVEVLCRGVIHVHIGADDVLWRTAKTENPLKMRLEKERI